MLIGCRRRVWVRIQDAPRVTGRRQEEEAEGRSESGPSAKNRREDGLRHVEVGGLTRTEGGDFSEEFAEIVSVLNPGVKDDR
ncbi:hypothetical protein [Streptosporangium subroseum]|uniref:hypothetical protein n=1 Tax=Streptosporangium subroseum TaxID=106412 RepID=UPI003090C076|nr:cytochrome c biogenesis protein ResB [Streptosporangium subroseum]